MQTPPALLRSNIEYAKKIFLERLGDVYVYGENYRKVIPGFGADCSGSAGVYLTAAMFGYSGTKWARLFSTENFPGPLQGFRRVSRQEMLDSKSPLKVCIHHGGGGPNSHMNVSIDGWAMESSGTFGTCGDKSGAISQSSAYWNAWWVYDGVVTEDTFSLTSPTKIMGRDYAGSRISGKALKDAGVKFVCRYLSDGGNSLPGKQLLPAEAADLQANGIQIVSNWENYANRMREGFQAGLADGFAADAWHRKCGGPSTGVIYFSCDYDAPESDQPAINDYLRGTAQALGSVDRVGMYGGYWPLSRAFDAGVIRWGWQTVAWSGSNPNYKFKNIDSRAHILQRNDLGFPKIAGVETDINETFVNNFGQWGDNVPNNNGGLFMFLTPEQEKELYEGVCYIRDQLGEGFDGWGEDGDLGTDSKGRRNTLRSALAKFFRVGKVN